MDEEDLGREDIFELEEGQQVNESWIIVRQIGRGAYGQVFHVLNKDDDSEGAMKIEALDVEERILRIELEILKAFKVTPDAYMQLYDYGTTDSYSFVVMTLGGPDLTRLQAIAPFGDNTLVRVALRTLIALKQLHDIGYVHRDLKPCNFASSLDGKKTIHVIDFGMCRQYAYQKERVWFIRKKRSGKIAFRGTQMYCSVKTHKSIDQCRADDLWGWFYMLIDFRKELPWRKIVHRDFIQEKKEQTTDAALCGNDPILSLFLPIAAHIRSLEQYDRPDYEMLTNLFENIMKEREFKLLDDYDWEAKLDDGNEVAEKINNIYEKFKIDKPRRKVGRKRESAAEEENEWRHVKKAASMRSTDVPGGLQYVETKGKVMTQRDGKKDKDGSAVKMSRTDVSEGQKPFHASQEGTAKAPSPVNTIVNSVANTATQSPQLVKQRNSKKK